MKPKGNYISIKPKPREMVRPSGIIIPSTTKKSNREWGEVVAVSGDLDISVGDSVYYFGEKCFEENGVKLVAHNSILYWEKKEK